MLKRLLEKQKEKNNIIHDENQYLYLIEDIIKYGIMESTRNGNALTIFGSSMHFSLENNSLPLLTTKKLAWKTCLKELLWFISGKTDNSILRNNNVKIWNENASREFLDSRKLFNLKENDLGPIYGHQWRHFNANYINCHTDYSNKGIDQLNNIINLLKNPNERNSRRLVISAWNPCQLEQMALPPCHIMMQFNVLQNKYLSCSMYQRSGDVGLGVPFNIASYSFLTHLIAFHCDLEPLELIYNLGNTHIYDDHLPMLKEQAKRVPYKFPKIKINKKKVNIEDYILEDFEIEDYLFSESINMKMRV